MKKNMKVKLIHSPCGRIPKQGKTVIGLGLRKIGSERILEDTPATRGMVNKIPHLVKIIEEKISK
jgi:ribosomal protein L30, bacterial/organelle